MSRSTRPDLTLALAFRDSDRGQMFYRGYNLKQLWTCNFEEMLHLMVWKEYPTALQVESLRARLAAQLTSVPENVVKAVRSFP